jgi:carbamoyl-phosphate synthase/aspartate carbamoyltransferase
VKYLEALQEDDESNPQKAEYSLTQHLAKNLIDLYVNLPSKNRYRRPASYVSKGYQSRRMAVDFAIPLITNVKCAKLFIEAIIRKPTLDISSVDYKTSHQTYTFPGLVNFEAFVPGVAAHDSDDFYAATQASVRGGFSMAHIVGQGAGSAIEDEKTLAIAQSNASGAAHCDYFFSASANAENASRLEGVQSGTRALYIPFNNLFNANNKVANVSQHFAAWPMDRPIITDAKTTDLATILLLASLNNRGIHVTNVSSRDDIQLIVLAKGKGLKVTCDVAVYCLFFTKEDFPKATCLPTAADQAALWNNFGDIDILSIGFVPYQLGIDLGQAVSAASGIEETLPLLLSAVADGRITLDDIVTRMYDTPRALFDLPEQPHTYVEVEVSRQSVFAADASVWSPLAGRRVTGAIHRVVVHGSSIYLDGKSTSMPLGRDLSGASLRTKPSRQSLSRQRPSISLASPIVPSRTLPEAAPSNLMSLAAHGAVEPFTPAVATRDVSSARSFDALQAHPAFYRRHILSVKQFDREDLHYLFSIASEMRTQVERSGSVDTLKGKVLCTLFYEPSTRTSTSFEAAMKRCGGQVTAVDADRSSVNKGESLADTIRTLGCYSDAIVIRHPSIGSSKTAAKFSPVPIINAGDGIGEHPTQSLLDVFCIREELGSCNGITVTLSEYPLLPHHYKPLIALCSYKQLVT